MEIDKDNNLWVGTPDGVSVGTINEQNFKKYNFMDSVIIGLISALYCDPAGNMWIGTERMSGKGNVAPGIIKYNSVRKDFKKVPALSGIIAESTGYG